MVEEFLRCDIKFNIPDVIIDSCEIFYKKEERTLSAALMFYCGKVLEGAHDAENDVLATIDVLKGQCNKYCKNILELLEECKDENQYLDLSRVIILKDGVPCYNIGKAKGVPVKKDIGFGEWI